MPHFYEEDEFDLQRMPGTRSFYTPRRTDPIAVHTPDHPFCSDPACSCHSNQEELDRVRQWVLDGLMTEEEASDFIAGKTK